MMYTTTTMIDDDMREVAPEEKRMKVIKGIIKFAVGGLVEIFVGAVTNSVIGGVNGSRAAKLGAKAGGFLVGMYIGDQVSDYILKGVDYGMEQLEELKNAMDEEES